MRQVSRTLAEAIEAPERTMRLRVSVDWDGDGHGGSGTIDDLSDKVGALNVERSMTGHLPDEVQVVEGTAAATATGDLVAGLTTDEALDVVRYWSRLNPASPLYGKPRLRRDVRVDVEFLTALGWEAVPRLHAATLDGVPVDAGARRAELRVVDARDRFRVLISLPPVIADDPWDGVATEGWLIPTKPGLEASWLVSYVMWQCGYPLAPPPRAQCRLYLPMHGSVMPFVQAPHDGSPRAAWEPVNGATDPQRVRFAEGPLFLCADPTNAGTSDGYVQCAAHMDAQPADGWNGTGRCTGVRIELRVLVTGAEPTQDAVSLIAFSVADAAEYVAVRLWVRNTGVTLAQLNNGEGNFVNVFGPTLSRGVWHMLGVHVDEVAGRMVWYVDGQVDQVDTFTATSPGTPDLTAVLVFMGTSYSKIAEVHVSMCTEATAWLPAGHTQTARVDRLQNRTMQGIYPDQPVEAWALLQQLAAAELGMAWIDSGGVPTVWSAARRNSPHALTVQRTLTARGELHGLAYRDDASMVRNVIRTPYVQLRTGASGQVWSLDSSQLLAPGETRVYLATFSAPLGTLGTAVAGSANTAANGTGTSYAVGAAQVAADLALTSTSTATLTLTNRTGVNLWLVDTSGQPHLVITGTPLLKETTTPVEVSDAGSMARYGPLPLDESDNPWVQGVQFATGRAYALLALLREEQVVYTGIEIPGDPRLEHLDRVRVVDEQGLVLDTPLLIEAVSDRFDGPEFRQAVVARPTLGQWVAGGPGVGTPLGSAILGGQP